MTNHIGDTNKMVSDTPRTEAEAFWPHDSQYKVCDAVFARQLEGELNAANADVERLTKANFQLREGAEELKQRIKRLEQGGDEAFYIANQYQRLEAWNKAKEAKP